MTSEQATTFIVDVLAAVPAWAQFLIVFFGVVVIALIVGAGIFLKSYFDQRGALSAQSDALERMTAVLAKNTETVKSIETEFEFKNWHKKEDISGRRAKLEALVEDVFAHYEWVERGMIGLVFEKSDLLTSEHGARVEAHLALYFPELQTEGHAFLEAASRVVVASRMIRLARRKRFTALPAQTQLTWNDNWDVVAPPTDDEAAEAKKVVMETYKARKEFRLAAAALMKTLRPDTN